MLIDPARDEPRKIYRALIGAVVPRPIAWVTTVNPAGRTNLAPFSFFNAFGGHPPVVVFAPNHKRDGSEKDTLRNVKATGEFVINVAVAGLAQQMNLSSKELPAEESEIDLTGLAIVPSQHVKPPRIRDTPIHIECTLRQVLQIGEGPMSANLVIGEVVLMHIADTIVDDLGRIDPRKLRAIGRLGADWYCQTDNPFEMKRP
jgi:flavin reductase (DIM6/NTAB) family NADH-FMN oxidoreductase RutF